MSSPELALLVVDDDPTIGSELEHALRDLVTIHVTPSAVGAFALLEAARYDAMVLDLVLAEGSGFDVLDHLQQQRLETPVVIVSAFLPDYSRELLRFSGSVRHILVKPVAAEELARTVLFVASHNS